MGWWGQRAALDQALLLQKQPGLAVAFRNACRQARALTVVSSTLSDYVRAHYATKCPIEVVVNGIREDLFHRLAVVPVKVPALAERREDIPFLVDMFMRQVSEQAGIRQRPDHGRRR